MCCSQWPTETLAFPEQRWQGRRITVNLVPSIWVIWFIYSPNPFTGHTLATSLFIQLSLRIGRGGYSLWCNFSIGSFQFGSLVTRARLLLTAGSPYSAINRAKVASNAALPKLGVGIYPPNPFTAYPQFTKKTPTKNPAIHAKATMQRSINPSILLPQPFHRLGHPILHYPQVLCRRGEIGMP